MPHPLLHDSFRQTAWLLALITLLPASHSIIAAPTMKSTKKRPQKPIDFNRDIRQILADKCFHCHGPDSHTREADLRLDTQEGAYAVNDGIAAVVPGNLDDSELYYAITTDDKDERMPPKKTGKELSKNEIQLLKRWIEEGAVWADHWAYEKPAKAKAPKVSKKDWPQSPIDHFILNRLEAEGLSPSPEADRATLIRRLSFDLTGLPPTPAEVAAFTGDKSPDAYERLVDRLLASPHYGERMAMYWLDLVRYADTVGYHGDQDHNIWPYRDYVIKAFNSNKPFTKFTEEQLAGDLIPGSTQQQKIASGYNRVLQTSHEGGVQPKEYLAIYFADRVRNLSNVWMGATVGCAQCHDHKYDPYTLKDFYTLGAFFADIDEAQHFKSGTNALPTRREPEMLIGSPDQIKKMNELNKSVAALKKKIKSLERAQKNKKTAKDKRDQLKKQISEEKKLLGKQNKALSAIKKNVPRTMITKATKPRTIRVLARGNWMDDSGEIVQPATPEFMRKFGGLDSSKRRANRLDLARWLTNGDSGLLTARVQVNRFWYLLFGTGISKGLDDFGGMGEAPVHGELLDHLAHEFVSSGWNIKHMMKYLVMSRTYKQSSLTSKDLAENDPENRLYARQSRYRMDAEMVRDNALSVSGLLVEKIGGPSVKPYQPQGHYRHLNFPKRKYAQHNDDRQWRRGLYVHWQRQFLHPMLKAFDAPSREECTAERPRSNTPLMSLALLNDPTFVEAARLFSKRLMNEGGVSDRDRITWGFKAATSRAPSGKELKTIQTLLDRHRAQFKKDSKAAKSIHDVGLKKIQFGSARETSELAAWTSVARVLLNLNETITRN